MNLVSVIIPIYKEIPNELEIISLKQCCKILGHYPIRFVAPLKLNTKFYENYCKVIKDFTIERFSDGYFQNLTEYNKLMLSLKFYKRFINFNYILIYQLDAFVFRDDLEYWCNQRFDYIGAPWFEKNNLSYNELYENFKDIGNGGFSLRNIPSHIRVLKSFKYFNKPFDLLKNLVKIAHRRRVFETIRESFNFMLNLSIKNNTFFLFNKKNECNEDEFWSKCQYLFKWFKIPNYQTSINFSFETYPSFLYKLNENKLPFGCHAWHKYEYDEFYSKQIKC